MNADNKRAYPGRWAALTMGLVCASALLGMPRTSHAQNASGDVVAKATHTSPYDAMMKINRFREEPKETETPVDYWGWMSTRLMNQAGRVLIKRPDPQFSEDAFFGWLAFFRTFGEGAPRGNCIACHTAPEFTDGGAHDIGTGGVVETPSLRAIMEKKTFLHDGSAKSIEEAIAAHVKNRNGKDPELRKIELDADATRRIAEFLKTFKDVDKETFRGYLLNFVNQHLDFEDI